MDNLKKKFQTILVLFLIPLFFCSSSWATQAEEKFVFEIEETLYAQALKEYEEKGYKPTQGVNIIIPATNHVASGGDGFDIAQQIGGSQGEFLLWTEENSWLEWQVDIPISGLYNIALKYYPLPGKEASLHRELKIDGEFPFNEAKRLSFTRFWRDEGKPKQDNQGNDIPPRQIEDPQWRYQLFEDIKGMYKEPLLFYLDKGRHYLRMSNIREPMALSFINILSPPYIPTYKEKIEEWRAKGYREVKDVFIKIQAEDSYLKSEPTIRREYGADPLEEPSAEGLFRLNRFGHWRWRVGNQWAMWKFSVPESGLYKISFKCWQGWFDTPSIRALKIDDQYPFEEMEEILFRYDKHHRIDTLSDEEGQPYLFYLVRGEHILELKVKVGPVREVVLSLQEVIRKINGLYREVIMITGVQPDPNREWYDLPYLVSELCPRLEEIAGSLDEEAEFLTQLVEHRPTSANTLFITSEQIKSMADKPHTIPERLDQISSTLSSLGYWALELQEGPLVLDYILITSSEANMPRARSTFLEKLLLGWQNFFASFHKEYTTVGSMYEAGAEEKIIEVWIARGREWVSITKEMIEDDFTPGTGIKVNVNILPPALQLQTLLLAMAAGEAPDVACGVKVELPVEFAIRNGVLDLSEFPDFPSVAKRFRPGALIPFHYRGNYYALPETQDFNMLFYRTDILEELKIEPPQTWDDLYKILPTLEQNGLEFFYAAAARHMSLGGLQTADPVRFLFQAGLTPFLFQRGGTYYTPDGLTSALDTPEALAAFREWTDLYTKYKIPIRADFFNRIRTGEMPIGIADYWNYVLLSTAAPELTGRWRMVPIPGIKKSDGTIDRSAGGMSQAVIVSSKTSHKEEAWEFVKWWTSAKVQARFGRELEALLGVEARWNTANVEGLKMMPWPEDDIKNILEQWEWFKEVPIVPGGYFTPRHVGFAWNKTVISGENPRETLEETVEEINRELLRKLEEFNLVGKEKIRQLEKEYEEKRRQGK